MVSQETLSALVLLIAHLLNLLAPYAFFVFSACVAYYLIKEAPNERAIYKLCTPSLIFALYSAFFGITDLLRVTTLGWITLFDFFSFACFLLVYLWLGYSHIVVELRMQTGNYVVYSISGKRQTRLVLTNDKKKAEMCLTYLKTLSQKDLRLWHKKVVVDGLDIYKLAEKEFSID